LQPDKTDRSNPAAGKRTAARQNPPFLHRIEEELGGKFKVSSGSFFHAAQSNAGRAYANLLARPIHEGMNILEIRVPAATPGIVGVADYVSVVWAFAAEITLQCHNATLPTLKR
jgi:hypothetical protein